MEYNESLNLLEEIRDEIRKVNKRLEWLEKTAKDEITKSSQQCDDARLTWKSYILAVLVLLFVAGLLYFTQHRM